MNEPLLDTDGENRAVRCFLMAYGAPGITVGAMRKHMQMCGFPHWPEWINGHHQESHLTKAGAQLWLRHLFALEGAATPASPATPLGMAPAAEPDRVQALRSGFMFGWKAAAVWANRTDLFADIGSPAYEKDCDAACGVQGTPAQSECETCRGVGTIDERLGGYSFSNPAATCPDCDGTGEGPAGVAPTQGGDDGR